MRAADFDPAQLRTRDADRIARYLRHLNFYQGKHWPEQSRHRQLVFNYAKVSIDKVTSFLMHGFTFTAYPAEESKDAMIRIRNVVTEYDRTGSRYDQAITLCAP